MNILGLKIEECCAASIMVDGDIVAAVAEERFVRRKNYSGFPSHSVEYCLREAGLTIEDIDLIAVESLHASLSGILYSYVQRRSSFSMEDYIREQNKYWFSVIYENRNIDYLEVFRDKIEKETFPEEFYDYFMDSRKGCKDWDVKSCQAVKKHLINLYYPGFDEKKMIFAPHHEAHAFYGYYSSKLKDNSEVLVVTADSYGDFENGIISKFDNGEFTLLHTLDNNNIGKLFRNITCLLGMKPYEHEYKVMGLAAYSTDYYSKYSYDVFDKTMQVDGINFSYEEIPNDYYFWFKDKLEGMRFDGIAGGIQRYTEDRMCEWIRNAVSKYNIKNVIFSGGIAMNIKLNMLLAKLPEIDSFFVPASADDTSNCIGACFYASHYHGENTNNLKNVYLGEDPGNREGIISKIEENNLYDSCNVVVGVHPSYIATVLANGKIIGRIAGRMEFGARALGNRSIIADPRDVKVVERINKIIKKRDFWMPFAPVILDTNWDKYLVNEKGVYSPYMTIGFDTTEKGKEDLEAAIHASDKTTRPQMLVREDNPSYYDIIKEFEKITGVGSLLNTSFNLHGFPIVRTVEDSIFVFFNSDLDGLLVNDVYIEKKNGK